MVSFFVSPLFSSSGFSWFPANRPFSKQPPEREKPLPWLGLTCFHPRGDVTSASWLANATTVTSLQASSLANMFYRHFYCAPSLLLFSLSPSYTRIHARRHTHTHIHTYERTHTGIVSHSRFLSRSCTLSHGETSDTRGWLDQAWFSLLVPYLFSSVIFLYFLLICCSLYRVSFLFGPFLSSRISCLFLFFSLSLSLSFSFSMEVRYVVFEA